MTLAITIVSALLLVGLAIVGFLRDLRRGLAALAGTLAGALAVGFWADPLTRDLARRFASADPNALARSANIAIFIATAVLAGYGGGLLLGKPEEPRSLAGRLACALLGLVNGALIGGYLLRFAAIENQPFLETLRTSPVGLMLYEQLPRLFMVFPLVIGLIVVARLVLSIFGLGRRAPPARQSGASGGAKPQSPNVEQQILDRMRERGQ